MVAGKPSNKGATDLYRKTIDEILENGHACTLLHMWFYSCTSIVLPLSIYLFNLLLKKVNYKLGNIVPPKVIAKIWQHLYYEVQYYL